jgi:general stress protein 26
MNKDILNDAAQSARETYKNHSTINKKQALASSLKLMERSRTCFLGTNGEDGFPRIKAMLNMKHEGLKKVWFSTNTSSKRVQLLKKDQRTCVYYVDEATFQGLLLVGTIKVLQDTKSRKMIWTKEAEVYYPLGVEDPDYCVLGFTAKTGNYYHGLQNVDFLIE